DCRDRLRQLLAGLWAHDKTVTDRAKAQPGQPFIEIFRRHGKNEVQHRDWSAAVKRVLADQSGSETSILRREIPT
ncbi:hypothetical protein ACXYUI_33485, partial [Klebsiella pneumoniae]